MTFTTWTNVSQWTSNPLYPDGGGDAYFTLSGSTGLTVDVPITLSHMYFSPASVLRVIGQRNLSLVGDAEIYVERSFTNSPPTVSGIAGAAGLTKTGDGWLILANTNSSSYTGTTRVMGGQLLVRADPALGAPSTPVFIDGGATVRFQNFSTARNVTIGPGGGSIGGGVPGTGTAEFSGTLAGSGTLNIQATPFIYLDGAITHTGPVIITGSTLQNIGNLPSVWLKNAATLQTPSRLELRGTELEVSSHEVSNGNRLGDDVPITMARARITVSSHPGDSLTERIGTISLMGVGTLYASNNNGTMTISIGSMVRTDRDIPYFDGDGHILLDQPPTLVGGGGAAGTTNRSIVPYARSSNLPFVTYDMQLGVQRLTSGEYATALPAGISDQNVLLSTQAVTSPATINALAVADGAAVQGPGTITVTSGAIGMAETASLSAPINLGTAEGYFTGNGTLTSDVSGSNGLVIAGGTLTLGGHGTYTGQTTIHGGSISLAADVPVDAPSPFGNDHTPVHVDGKVLLQPLASGTTTIARDLTVRSFSTALPDATLTVAPNQTLHVSGAIQNDGLINLQTNGGTLLLSGAISGQGSLTIPNNLTGTVTLSGNNTFSGGVSIGDPNTTSTGLQVNAASDTAFGTGTLSMNYVGTLRAQGGARTIANPVSLVDARFEGSLPITFTGPIDTTFGTRFALVGPVVTVSQGITGPDLQTVGGLGRLETPFIRVDRATVLSGVIVTPPNGTPASTSRIGTLSISHNVPDPSRIDLTDNDLIITATPASSVISEIVRARHNGAWDADGVTSSAAAAQPSHASTLGLLPGSDYRSVYGGSTAFDGFAVANTDVLVKYTWYGDTDFNGRINFDDYVRTDNGFNSHLTGWLNGDFDLNGQVNFDDYVLIDLAFNTQSGTLGRALSFLDGSARSADGMSDPALRRVQQHLAEFGSDYASHFLAAVPEPVAVTLIGATLPLCLRKRRRPPAKQSTACACGFTRRYRREGPMTPRHYQSIADALERRLLLAGADLDMLYGVNGFAKPAVLNGPAGYYISGLAPAPDGNIYAAGTNYDDFALTKLTPDGQADPHFGDGGVALVDMNPDFEDMVEGICVQPNGKIVVAGIVRSHQATGFDMGLARFNPDGSLDTTFGDVGRVLVDFGNTKDLCEDVVVQDDGRILAIGSTDDGHKLRAAIAAITSNGALDTTYGSGGRIVIDVAPGGTGGDWADGYLQPDGKLVVIGGATFGTPSQTVAGRFNLDGTRDNSFGNAGLAYTSIAPWCNAIAPAPGGGFFGLNGSGGLQSVKFIGDGSVDTAWGNGGVSQSVSNSTTIQGGSLAVAPDGSIFAARGVLFGLILARFTPMGNLDTRFNGTGYLTPYYGSQSVNGEAILLQPDGPILVGGSNISGWIVARYRDVNDVPGMARLSAGIVAVTGTDAADTVEVSSDGAEVHVTLNGTTFDYAAAEVNRVDLRMAAGNDAVVITDGAPRGGVDLAAGTDTLTITASAPATEPRNVLAGDGSDTLAISVEQSATTFDGQAGSDTLQVNGTPAADDLSLTGAMIQNNSTDSAITYSSTETIRINLGDGDDSLIANGASIPAATVNGEAGNDLLSVSDVSGANPVFLGGTGADSIDVLSGLYVMNVDPGAGSAALTINVRHGVARFLASVHLVALNIFDTGRAEHRGSSRLLITNSLALEGDAELDLFNNDMLLDYAGASPLALVQSLINSARATGNWTGHGITSSSARAAVPENVTLGAMEATDYATAHGGTFDGVAPDSTAVLVKFTWYGDTDFNGKVNFDDYVRTDNGFNNHLTGWLNGDFDGNGHVSFDDYVLIDLAFNTQSGIQRP